MREFRVTAVRWFGPFKLHGKPGTSLKDDAGRLREIDNTGLGAMAGLYMFVGRQGKMPWRQRNILYIGITSNFRTRFKDHLDPTEFHNGGVEKRAKLNQIERYGRLDSIWLGIAVSHEQVMPGADREDNESLLISVFRPWLNVDVPALTVSTILVNQFDETLYAAKGVSNWRPNVLPDLVEYSGADNAAVLTWTGARKGMSPRRRVQSLKAG